MHTALTVKLMFVLYANIEVKQRLLYEFTHTPVLIWEFTELITHFALARSRFISLIKPASISVQWNK